MIQKPFDYVPAPNMGNPNFRFNADTLGSGRGKIGLRCNQCNPGVSFGKMFAINDLASRPNPLKDNALWREDRGTLRMRIDGISRDNAGAILGSCQVLVFRTWDKVLMGETTSDVNGVWAMDLLISGPFFYVEYKAGAPDKTGASLNTLLPLPVAL